jgi:rRNA maturation endonuclease Nob1
MAKVMKQKRKYTCYSCKVSFETDKAGPTCYKCGKKLKGTRKY